MAMAAVKPLAPRIGVEHCSNQGPRRNKLTLETTKPYH